MATRFYLSSTVTSPVTPGFAAWTRNTEGDRRKMSPTDGNSVMTSKTFWANQAAAASATCLNRQYISDPMSAGIAFTIGDTVKLVLRCMESAVNDNINRCPICIKVYSADGLTLRATLLALLHYGPNTTEWATALSSKQAADGDAITVAWTTLAGDRLVVEIGGQVSTAAGASVTGTQSFGENGASDLLESEGVATALNPWFEISRDITFLQTISAAGAIATQETFGTPTVIIPQYISNAGAITSLEAFGTGKIILYLSPSGIATLETFGTVKVNLKIAPSGIVSIETFGSAKLILYLLPSGILSVEVFGNATVISGAQFLQPPSINSQEAFGTAKINLRVTPASIASGEAFGTPNVAPEQFLQPGSVPSEESFGVAKLNLNIAPAGIASAETFGSPSLSLKITPSAIVSTETFGTPKLKLTISVSSIPSGEAFGSAKLNLNLSPSGIGSLEAFGVPLVVMPQVVSPASIPTGEAFGNPALVNLILPAGIASEEGLGTPLITIPIRLYPDSVVSGEMLGSCKVILWARYPVIGGKHIIR
jgi:hypothetical protein